MDLLPSPDEIAEDLGELDPDPEPRQEAEDRGRDGYPTGPDGPDEPPAHARRRRRGRPPGAKTHPPATGRVPVGVRSDIEAKIGFGLEMGAQFWKARDPFCGGTAVQQVPATAAALTNWVVRSPALVEWFTSPAGSGFMLLLDTGAAVMPVIGAVMAHHVYHSVEFEPEDVTQPQQYAA